MRDLDGHPRFLASTSPHERIGERSRAERGEDRAAVDFGPEADNFSQLGLMNTGTATSSLDGTKLLVPVLTIGNGDVNNNRPSDAVVHYSATKTCDAVEGDVSSLVTTSHARAQKTDTVKHSEHLKNALPSSLLVAAANQEALLEEQRNDIAPLDLSARLKIGTFPMHLILIQLAYLIFYSF